MKALTALVVIIACVTGARLHAQTASATPESVAAAPKAVAAAPAKPAKKPKKEPAQKENKSPGNSLFGQSAMGLNTNEPTTTEIYADEAFFDSTKNMGTFSGRVKVTDPRFNLQSDKLTVFITKGENQGLGEGDRRRTRRVGARTARSERWSANACSWARGQRDLHGGDRRRGIARDAPGAGRTEYARGNES